MNTTEKTGLKNIITEYFTPHTGYATIFVSKGQKIKKGDRIAEILRLGVTTEYDAKNDGIIIEVNEKIHKGKKHRPGPYRTGEGIFR